MWKRCLYLILTLLFTISAGGQHVVPGYSVADPVWLEQLLFRGEEWHPGMTSVTGNEFLMSEDYLDAELTVSGFVFPGQKIRYDIYRDQVVILWKDINALVMGSNDVDEFSIIAGDSRRRFINLREGYPGLRGFAEVIYSGKSMLVAKHIKVIGKNSSLTSYAQFREHTKYYFISGGRCMPVRSRRAFLEMFGEHRNEVRRYIHQNQIDMSRYSPGGFGLAAAYYDSLTNDGS